jgi:hypothetical protein
MLVVAALMQVAVLQLVGTRLVGRLAVAAGQLQTGLLACLVSSKCTVYLLHVFLLNMAPWYLAASLVVTHHDACHYNESHHSSLIVHVLVEGSCPSPRS